MFCLFSSFLLGSPSCPSSLPCLPLSSPFAFLDASLPSIPSVLADGRQERARTAHSQPRRHSRCTPSRPVGLADSKKVPHLELRQHRFIVPTLASLSLTLPTLGSLSLHFANLGSSLPSLSLHFANYLRFTHHFHFTLPTLASLSPHFANLGFTLHGYGRRWQIATLTGQIATLTGVNRGLIAEGVKKLSSAHEGATSSPRHCSAPCETPPRPLVCRRSQATRRVMCASS